MGDEPREARTPAEPSTIVGVQFSDVDASADPAGFVRYLDGAGERFYGCASIDETGRQVILKIVNAQPEAKSVQINLAGAGQVGNQAELQMLASDDLNIENSLDEPTKFTPQNSTKQITSAQFTHEVPGQSLTVMRIPMR